MWLLDLFIQGRELVFQPQEGSHSCDTFQRPVTKAHFNSYSNPYTKEGQNKISKKLKNKGSGQEFKKLQQETKDRN